MKRKTKNQRLRDQVDELKRSLQWALPLAEAQAMGRLGTPQQMHEAITQIGLATSRLNSEYKG